MRIAQVAPLFESVPPMMYGGTERVVSNLTEELVRQGHEVTLFASGDSVTAARLISSTDVALRLANKCNDPLPPHLLQLENVRKRASEFDVVHFHCDYIHFPTSRAWDLTQLTTLHGRLDLPELVPLYREYSEMPLVSISDAQREPLPWVNWVGTVHHGLPGDGLKPFFSKGSYLAFLGRISPEKRVDRAIEIAVRAGLPLKIAAKVDKVDVEYYETKIRPMILQSPSIEFIGEVNEEEKQEFLSKALALLFPIDWPEPFGLVMIEAMACGTPVIAFRRGSVPEVIWPGVSGYIVDSVDAAVDAVERIGELPRTGCRADFEKRFTVRRMAHDYLNLYAKLRHGKLGESRVTDNVIPSFHASGIDDHAAAAGGASFRIRGHHPVPQPVLRTGEFLSERKSEAGAQAAR